MSNTITAYFKGRVGVAEAVYQNDYGIVMNFDSIDLPAHFDCYFSKLNQEEALPGVGADNRVTIPNSVLANSGNVTIHIPLHTGENDSEVEYVAYFKVIGRARPIDDGTPAQMTAIERALALLSQPITNIEEIVNEALSFTGDTFAEMKQELADDFAEYKGDVDDDIADFKTEIRGDIADVEHDFDILDGQFQTAVAAITVDSEVQGIRTGDDGVTYTSAGEAVRKQFSDVKSAMNSVKTETASPISLAWEHGGIDNATGQTNNEGSLVRSRDVTYYKESDLYKWYNPNAYTAYGIFYTYDGSSYTFTSNVALNVAEYTFNPNSDKYVRFDIREGLDNAKTVSVTAFSNIVNDVLQLKSDINEIEYGTNLTLQRAKSDDNNAWGDVRVSPVTYIGQVITITNNGATYIIVRPKDSNGDDIGAYVRIEPSGTGTLFITAIPDYINIYCDVYPIDVSIQSPSATAYVESKVDDVSEQLDDVAIDYLDGKICYANLSDFDLTQNQYYGNDLTTKTPTDGNTYHVAEQFDVPAGTYAFYGIDPYWSFYVTLGGTQVRMSTVEVNGVITIPQSARIYLSTRENITGYNNANFVSGNEVFSVAPSKGYFSKKIEQLDGFTQIMASVNMFNSVGALGDSYTAASVKNSDGVWRDYPDNSWVATMCKRSGVDWFNYGVGGTTAKTYANSNVFANQVLTEAAKDIYFICLGINDSWQATTLGSITDINDADYTQNGDSFYGWYGRIIARLMLHAPDAKIVLIKPWTYDSAHSVYGDAIETIADHYGIPYIDPYDDVFFSGGYLSPSINGGHPTLMGYNMMGIAMERLFSKCVVDHPSYFKYATVG